MPDEGAVSCVLAKVDTEAGREVVRAIPPEHVRSAKALVDEALTIKNSDIAKHLNLPPVKLHCSMLAEEAVQAAIDDYKKKKQASG